MIGHVVGLQVHDCAEVHDCATNQEEKMQVIKDACLFSQGKQGLPGPTGLPGLPGLPGEPVSRLKPNT